MRTGATQSVPTANPDVRITLDGDTYTSQDGGRVNSVISHEKLYGGEYIIELDNSDDALTSKDYRGSTATLYFGFISVTGSNMPSLFIDNQEFISKNGKLLMSLHCIDLWGKLSFYTAAVDGIGGSIWNYPQQSSTALAGKTLPSGADIPASLITAITSQYDITIEDIIAEVLTNTLGVSATPETGHTDTAYYAFKPLINAQDARSVIAQAIQHCQSYLKLKTTAFEVVNPTSASVAYSYSTDDLFFSNIDYQALVRPNTIVFHGIDSGGNMLATASPHGIDSTSVSKIGTISAHFYCGFDDLEKLTTQTQVDDAADTYLSKLQTSLSMGQIVAPMHCSQELLDKVSIVDSRYSSPRTTTGYVFEIIREYQANKGVYRITLILGGVSTYYTPEGGKPIQEAPIFPPVPPSLDNVDVTDVALLPIKTDLVFSADDQDDISWSAGTIYLANGTTQAINSGSLHLANSNKYFIYCDLDDATPATLKNTQTFGDAVTGRHLWVTMAKKGTTSSDDAQIVIVSQNKDYMVSELSAFVANLGLITTGEFRLGNGNQPGSGFTGIRIYKSGTDYHIESIVNDVIHTQQDENGITLARTSSGDDENLILKYGSTIVGYIYPASGVMVILGNRDLELGSANGYGISIHAGALTSPTDDNLFLAAQDMTRLYSKGNMLINCGYDSINSEYIEDSLLQINASDSIALIPDMDNGGDGVIYCNGTFNAAGEDIYCDTLYYTTLTEWPDFLNDFAIVKSITASDGKHLDIDSLHPYLRIDKESKINKLRENSVSFIKKLKEKTQLNINTELDADKKEKLQQYLSEIDTKQEEKLNKKIKEVESLYETHIPVNSLLSLAIATCKQLILKQEDLEARILKLEKK